MPTTVTAFIFYHEKLLLILHRKHGTWLHVGGHVEEGETLEEALHREIREEVGLAVIILEPKPFFTHESENHGVRTTHVDFICEVRGSPEVKIAPEEILEYRWIGEGAVDRLETSDEFKELARRAFSTYLDD